MSKSDYLESGILQLLFHGAALANVADNAAASPVTNLTVALHTADPGESGDQTTNEVAYTGYARQSVARSSAGWTVSGNQVFPAADIEFPAVVTGSGTITHVSLGTGLSDNILYYGALTPNITIQPGLTPVVKTTSVITEG